MPIRVSRTGREYEYDPEKARQRYAKRKAKRASKEEVAKRERVAEKFVKDLEK